MSSFIFSQCLLRGIKDKFQPQLDIKRFRWWKDQKAKPLIRRYGFNKDYVPRGLLPRLKSADRYITMPIYTPQDPWQKDRALKGQNDCIDILGDGSLEPYQISYDVPSWLRGFQGNELQKLIHKMKKHSCGTWKTECPTKYQKTKQRIDYLWYRLNYRRQIK